MVAAVADCSGVGSGWTGVFSSATEWDRYSGRFVHGNAVVFF